MDCQHERYRDLPKPGASRIGVYRCEDCGLVSDYAGDHQDPWRNMVQSLSEKPKADVAAIREAEVKGESLVSAESERMAPEEQGIDLRAHEREPKLNAYRALAEDEERRDFIRRASFAALENGCLSRPLSFETMTNEQRAAYLRSTDASQQLSYEDHLDDEEDELPLTDRSTGDQRGWTEDD